MKSDIGTMERIDSATNRREFWTVRLIKAKKNIGIKKVRLGWSCHQSWSR